MERENCADGRSGKSLNPKENVFGSQSYVTASLFLFYLVDEPFLINDRPVSNKQGSSNWRFEQQA